MRISSFFISSLVSVIAISCCSIAAQSPTNIDGVYQFVSETTTLTKPRASEFRREAPQWTGLVFFSNKHFSVSLLNQLRDDDWLAQFPKNAKEIGYDSFAGSFELTGSQLLLRKEVGLNPYDDRGTNRFEIRAEGNRLTMTETLSPYVEDLRAGKRIIVLEKQ